ncbi:acetyl-CoA carboxylase biotin carboxylase subunit [Lentilactobacillus fungorum]|uniref:biotin carboxylase n=1 Tax=Lentilactobacillus fungorum TaxID=2201250 RepID=A0ABQ3VZ07_9LACO|nr:acetyl-CoA carboxylase biotin carboxylase subunit [Lentilactobacillus fungorum]GHP13426.1 acetyl-CoA carboxylase biotin carboxylase subunit [Lentilactobacillus fungorum]
MNQLFSSHKPVKQWPFHKVLIANRGEIAVRIIRACRQLGLESVAIYSTADKDALHTKLADSAVCIGPANAANSYLNINNIITAAQVTGADAIHPGYGFLSENADFARACEQNHLIFIGPSADAISLLGNKEQARQTMVQAGMPLVKGSPTVLTDSKAALTEAKKIGFPIMIKASAGGGGKGMRVVQYPEQFESTFDLCQDEARSAFDDDHMYLEQYLTHPRHIEIQLIADQGGNTLAIGERDCTIQANHQKVMEEAPAPSLDDTTRQQMFTISEQAVAHIHYEGVGTVEFLYNGPGAFYFMEMNTRIQVEHPITEQTTGLDLIEAQFRVAAGEPLVDSRPTVANYALECRITALTPGTISGLHLPGGLGIRVDTALYQGYNVPPNYDAMIAKLIVYGPNRNVVLTKMRNAIDETVIAGISTNLELLAQLLAEPDLIAEKTDVNWLDHLLAAKEEDSYDN